MPWMSEFPSGDPSSRLHWVYDDEEWRQHVGGTDGGTGPGWRAYCGARVTPIGDDTTGHPVCPVCRHHAQDG
ncbi:hypothetical protein SAMN05421810_11470 [Amycolatopsis arida]|uniref:Zinc-finger n=1 Tax=Amycolatopsis arida TaxID=587909 RepID=A0A1I6ASE3_9PSEU|nr:hypothetical protein [Amycolatopsis arida]TDX97553.1 hypothetical protein CLV69_102657 [Amycolatopsis arida]SFQ71631.1 hypothetical protein SAMN05421810_11470 [Amycolatopsis arida]